MHKNLRLLSILEKLSKAQSTCLKNLATEYKVSLKSIQNDFKILNEYFGDKLVKKGDCYFLLNQEYFSDIFTSDPQTIKRFLRLVSIVDSSLYDSFFQEYGDLLKSLKLFDSSSVYQVENSPFEQLQDRDREVLEQLEELIAHRNYIDLYYQRPDIDAFRFSHSIPLKILYLNENWYLALLTTNDIIDNSAFKLLRVKFIDRIRPSLVEPKFFHEDNSEKLKAEEFLQSIQSAYNKINQKPYTVTLKVSVEVARYFKSKSYLKSQKVTQRLENGDIIVTYEITHEMEIIPLIQRWIPYVKVIEPVEIREKVEQNIRQFMKEV